MCKIKYFICNPVSVTKIATSSSKKNIKTHIALSVIYNVIKKNISKSKYFSKVNIQCRCFLKHNLFCLLFYQMLLVSLLSVTLP